jgi:hypothetical protein
MGGDLYLSGPDGSDPMLFWEPPSEYWAETAWWLTDDMILVELCAGQWPNCSPHLLELRDRSLRSLPFADARLVVGVAPDGSIWLEWGAGLFVARPDGSRREFQAAAGIGLDPPMASVAPPFAFLPDGSGVLFNGVTGDWQLGTLSRDIYFARVVAGEVQPGHSIYHLNADANVKSMRLSPDGRYLAYVDIHGMEINILDLIDISVGGTFHIDAIAEPLFVWSPDGSQLAVTYTGPPEAITLVDVATGERETLLSAPQTWFVPVDWRFVEVR